MHYRLNPAALEGLRRYLAWFFGGQYIDIYQCPEEIEREQPPWVPAMG
jgi:hypothetical protein